MPGKFKVYITRYAYSQLKEIRQYIAEELFIPDTAKKLLLNIRKATGRNGYGVSANSYVDCFINNEGVFIEHPFSCNCKDSIALIETIKPLN